MPWLYAFFIVNLLGFYLLFDPTGDHAQWVARVFFVWVSVFNVFAVSVFWSFTADLFDTEQARRLYGFIAAGGTAGALAGPSLTALFVVLVGARGMLLVSAGFLLAAIGAIAFLRSATASRREAAPAIPEAPLGGSIWAGLRDVVPSPYLLGICLFLFGYSLLSTFLYFQQAALGLSLVGMSLVAVPIAVIWLGVAAWLGRAQPRRLGSVVPAKVH